MIDINEWSDLFSDLIIATENPFKLTLTTKCKVGDQIVTSTQTQWINLLPVESAGELISKNKGSVEEINFYPKSVFKKIFRIYDLRALNKIEIGGNIAFISRALKPFFPNQTYIRDLEEDNKIIIYQKAPVVVLEEGNKIWAWSDPENYRNILVK